jgi:hypothetical protein
MPVEFYRTLHLIGIFTVILSLGGMCLHVISGGTRNYGGRKLAAMTHGIGLLVVLVAGFGLLAKLGYMRAIPGWAIAKVVIWLILGVMPALIYRKPNLAKTFWVLILVFGALNAYLAIYKPF